MNVRTRVFGFIACLLGSLPAAAGEIVVGANIGNVPWEFADSRGEYVGFEIDLVTANQKGAPVVTGSATALLPRRG